jgi:hypothetical protein
MPDIGVNAAGAKFSARIELTAKSALLKSQALRNVSRGHSCRHLQVSAFTTARY